MAMHKHPISQHWIRHTLVPFLLYAFASTLPYPANLSDQIQRSLEFCLQKPDHPSDGDDLVFERIFMAIMHRHKNLAPDLEMVVDNLEPLAKYLIRRAQLKGPYELLGRSDVGSAAWVEYERYRLSNVILKPEEIQLGTSCDEQRDRMRLDHLAGHLPPTRPPIVPKMLALTENVLDTRLVHEQSHSAATTNITEPNTDNDSHFRYQKCEFEQRRIRKQPQKHYRSAMPAQNSSSACNVSGGGYTNSSLANGSPHQQELPQGLSQQLTPSFVSTQQQALQQAAPLRQTTPTITLLSRYSFLETQSKFPSKELNSTFAQPQPIAQHASAQHQPLQHQAVDRWGVQQQPARSSSPACRYSGLVMSLPQLSSPSKNLLPQQLALTSTHTQAVIPSSDSAHLRGTDWSAAAAQRAREIAAEITAQERNTLAHSIIQHQQAMAQNLPKAGFTRVIHCPTKPPYAFSPRSNSTMGHSPAQSHDTMDDAPPAMHTQFGSGVNECGTTLPDYAARPAMPTIEQIRSRYFPALHQARTVASAVPVAVADSCGLVTKALPAQGLVPSYEQNRQLLPPLVMMGASRRDAVEPLQGAANEGVGMAARTEPYNVLARIDMCERGVEAWAMTERMCVRDG